MKLLASFLSINLFCLLLTQQWFDSYIFKCSKSCGNSGIQRRQTSCGHPRENISSKFCTFPAPIKERTCNNVSCG